MEEVEKAFSVYSRNYDQDFTNTPIGQLQRKRVHRLFNKAIEPDYRKILEVGCGTGEDAHWFAHRGFTVTATDISSGMIEAAIAKNINKGKIKFVQCGAMDIAKRFVNEKFDIIFSDFGALNCLSPEEMAKWGSMVSGLLNKNGKVILVIMGRNCKWEQRYYLKKGDRETAYRRRKREGVESIINDVSFTTHYYSPNELAWFFENDFKVKKTRPIGYFIPPSYLNPYFIKHPFRLKFLAMLESLFAFMKNPDKADHYYIEMQLK